MKYQCIRCGTVKETTQEMLTCSDACKSWYKRWKRQHPGQTLAAIPIHDDPPRPSGGSPQETHKQAVFEIPEGYTLIDKDTHKELLQSHMLVNDLMLRGVIAPSGEKKSDFVPGQTTFTPPTEKPVVREVSDEERIKRTAANTAAALEDF